MHGNALLLKEAHHRGLDHVLHELAQGVPQTPQLAFERADSAVGLLHAAIGLLALFG